MAERSKNEGIKEASRFLRGTIAEGLERAETGAISDDDQQLVKFHGSYLQDDRDLRGERTRKKLDKAYSFMIRLRIPGGLVTPAQWLQLDDLAENYANKTLRITTRQTFQFHGVLKTNMRPAMQAIHAALLDTIAACGDVNRNVMSAANPHLNKAHAEAYDLAGAISARLLPKTGAYHEIWLDGEQIYDGSVPPPEAEPLYGQHYLPRKFKIVVAVPPSNDVDIYAHDVGFIAIEESGEIVGYNVTVGGGMGMTHGETATFPRLADVIGFCTPDQAVDVAEKVMLVQRDWGNRADRKQARLKYTIETHGLDAFRAEVETRLGAKFGPARPFAFHSTGDPIGWRKGEDGKWHLTLFVQNGRVKDVPGQTLRAAVREIAEMHDGMFGLTGNQNLIVTDVSARGKAKIEAILKKHGCAPEDLSGLRRNSMACVALPTCGLALAESERYLPDLVTALEDVVEQSGIGADEIVIRMTGCPNGCARPYLAEIGLVGRTPGIYNLYLGAAFDGSRLNKLYAADIDHDGIIEKLSPLLRDYATRREANERFGDFVIRAGHVAATHAGREFHDNVGPQAA